MVCKAGRCLFVLCCYGDDAALSAEVTGPAARALTRTGFAAAGLSRRLTQGC